MLVSGIFTILPLIEFVLKRALTLSSGRNIKGVKFWDVVIVATMLENDIPVLYTENVADFRKFIDVVEVRNLQEELGGKDKRDDG